MRRVSSALGTYPTPSPTRISPARPPPGPRATPPGGFDAPRARNTSNAFWNAWSYDILDHNSVYPAGNPSAPAFGFRQVMIKHFLNDLLGWVVAAGIPSKIVYAHQIPGETAGATRARTGADPMWAAVTDFNGHMGVTRFGSFPYQTAQTHVQNWGIFEWHPDPGALATDPLLYASTITSLNNYHANGAHVLFPGGWENTNGTTFLLTDSNFAVGLHDWLLAQADLPMPGGQGLAARYFISVYATLGTARGQFPASTPAPPEPLLARAADGSWTVTYKFKAPPPAASPSTAAASDRIASIHVEKTGAKYHVVTTKNSGRKSEIWCMGDIEIYKPDNVQGMARIVTDSPYYLDFSKTDFDELSWIGMDNYKGVTGEGLGEKRFAFEIKNVDRRQTAQEKAMNGDPAAAAEKSGMVGANSDKKQVVSELLAAQFGDTVSRASIDVTRQLPVEYDDGQVVRTYAFSEIPSIVPPDVLKLFQEINKQIKKSTVPAPPP